MAAARLSAGDWVEIRSKEEILRTLDREGRLDGMPFMPEMLEFCGQRLPVYKRAHKTCDTVFPLRERRVHRAVHLQTRCSGAAHGGCQAGCLLFWKEDWLKPVDAVSPAAPPLRAGCEESALWANVQKPDDGSDTAYVCQATQVPYATTHLDWWDVRQYIEDYRSGNTTLGNIAAGFLYWAYYGLSHAGLGLGRPMRWLYDRCSLLWDGTRFPRTAGTIPDGKQTPTEHLGLQAGDLVRVKRHDEILRTLTTASRNRGLAWDADLVPYCGKTYRVLRRVTKIINEKTGKMQEMKNPCIVLDSVVCQGRYSTWCMFCPRGIYPYWREIWLERVGSDLKK